MPRFSINFFNNLSRTAIQIYLTKFPFYERTCTKLEFDVDAFLTSFIIMKSILLNCHLKTLYPIRSCFSDIVLVLSLWRFNFVVKRQLWTS